jgi:hypothetical protein
MAVNVNKENLSDKGSDDREPRKQPFVPKGNQLARLVGYAELGKHYQIYKGKRTIYEQGKNKGREKPPVLHVVLEFEFPKYKEEDQFPLTLSTTRRMKGGEFFNAVVVPQSLIDNTLGRGYAMRTRFMKFLTAIQEASGKNYTSFMKFAKEKTPLMMAITNKVVNAGTEDEKTYANFKPDGIVAPEFVHPATGEVEKFEVPEAESTGYVFDWDTPTEEQWKSLPKWHQAAILDAVDYAGSPIEALLNANPEWLEDEKKDDEEKAEEPEGSDADPNEDIPV